ncbi:MAG: hypothetical protein KDB82_10635 [Planctomycetes bacterium]|nr:hypothetical protein [Planctomycetota bacterium]
MKPAIGLLLLAALVLASCGQETPAPVNQAPAPVKKPVDKPKTPATPPDQEVSIPDTIDEFADVPEPKVEVDPAWMVFEGGDGKFGATVGHPGREAQERHNLWRFDEEVSKYATTGDPEHALPGLDQGMGFSRNPMVFRSAPRITARAFHLFLDKLLKNRFGEQVWAMPVGDGTELRVRYSFKPKFIEEIPEPPPPEQPPEEQVEFPKDEPVQADPTEEPRIVEGVQPKPKAPPAPPPLDELRDWQKNSIDILPVFDREKEVFGFRTEWAQRTSQHDDTAFRLSDLCDKNGQLNLDQYKRLRSRLASAILSRVPADGSVIKVCVHLEGKCVNRKNPPKDLMVDWVVAFLQADAIRLLNDSGKLPGNELNTEFEWIYD